MDSASANSNASANPLNGSMGWLCGLLQTNDSLYPTGSYAHSFGLEGLVQAGVVRDRATLGAFIFQSVLPSLREAELPLAAHAYAAISARDWIAVEQICRLAAALKPPQELREASAKIGRQRAELLATVHRDPLAEEYVRRAVEGGWPFAAPVSAALEGCALGAPRSAVLAGIAYASVASVLSAAMKLLRLGQNASQSLLAEALAEMPGIIAAAEMKPLAEIGWSNPWLDIAAARHESADGRMFIS